MNELRIDTAGQLTRDPELRYTPGGKAVASFAIAVNSSYRDGDGVWTDREPVYLDCTVWGEHAERIAPLGTGDRVMVSGKLVSRSFTAERGERAGQTIRRLEVHVDEVGASLLRADVAVTRVRRGPAAG
jgi:single-strand DNA-binding protein